MGPRRCSTRRLRQLPRWNSIWSSAALPHRAPAGSGPARPTLATSSWAAAAVNDRTVNNTFVSVSPVGNKRTVGVRSLLRPSLRLARFGAWAMALRMVWNWHCCQGIPLSLADRAALGPAWPENCQQRWGQWPWPPRRREPVTPTRQPSGLHAGGRLPLRAWPAMPRSLR
jgi:hypothetical protein